MLRRDGGGDGQPQAEAGLLPPGGVRPVEPLKQTVQLLRRDGLPGVGHQKPGLPVRPPQRQGDGAPRLSVFDGVVQQDADQLAQLVRIAGDENVRRDIALQRLSRLKGHRFEGQGAVRGQIGEGDLPHHRRGHGVVRPGQGQHLLHQRPHPLGLGVDVVRPPGRAVVQRRCLQQLRVGEDDGQGRFQLMGGVRQELPLLPPRLCHRRRCPPGQQDGDPQQQHQRRRADLQIRAHALRQGGLLHGHVHKGDPLIQQILPLKRPLCVKEVVLPEISQAVFRKHALVLLLIQTGGHDGFQQLRVLEIGVGAAGDRGGCQPGPIFLRIPDIHRKIGQQHILPPRITAEIRQLSLRVLLLDDPLQHLMADDLDVLLGGEVHRQKHHGQDCGHQQHAHGHEFDL